MTVDTVIEILTVRRACMECVMGNGSCEDCDHAFDMAIEALEERKTGRWIPHYSGYRQYNGYDCSLCGGWCIGQKKYCGECGAKMEGAE